MKTSSEYKARLGDATKKVVATLRAGAQVAQVLFFVGLAAFLLYGAFVFVPPWAQDQFENWIEGDPYLKVWVNPEAKVYYEPGDKAYGNTIPGFYVSQADARTQEYRSTENSWLLELFSFEPEQGIGYGNSAVPLRTDSDLTPFAKSTLSWGGAEPADENPFRAKGNVILSLDNTSDWDIREVTVWISTEAGTDQTYRLVGDAIPKSKSTFQVSVGDAPSEKKWTWGFSKVKGVPP